MGRLPKESHALVCHVAAPSHCAPPLSLLSLSPHARTLTHARAARWRSAASRAPTRSTSSAGSSSATCARCSRPSRSASSSRCLSGPGASSPCCRERCVCPFVRPRKRGFAASCVSPFYASSATHTMYLIAPPHLLAAHSYAWMQAEGVKADRRFTDKCRWVLALKEKEAQERAESAARERAVNGGGSGDHDDAPRSILESLVRATSAGDHRCARPPAHSVPLSHSLLTFAWPRPLFAPTPTSRRVR